MSDTIQSKIDKLNEIKIPVPAIIVLWIYFVAGPVFFRMPAAPFVFLFLMGISLLATFLFKKISKHLKNINWNLVLLSYTVVHVIITFSGRLIPPDIVILAIVSVHYVYLCKADSKADSDYFKILFYRMLFFIITFFPFSIAFSEEIPELLPSTFLFFSPCILTMISLILIRNKNITIPSIIFAGFSAVLTIINLLYFINIFKYAIKEDFLTILIVWIFTFILNFAMLAMIANQKFNKSSIHRY
jgi:hypothetical protein